MLASQTLRNGPVVEMSYPKFKHQTSTTVLISPPIAPIKKNKVKGERPFSNKTRVILFFRSTKPKLRDFERFIFILGDLV